METAVGVLLALLSAASYGTMPVLAHVAYDSAPHDVPGVATVLAAVVIWPIVLVRRRPLPRVSCWSRCSSSVGSSTSVKRSPTSLPWLRRRHGHRAGRLHLPPCSSWCWPRSPGRRRYADEGRGCPDRRRRGHPTVGGSGQAQALGIVLAVAAGLIFSFYFFFSDRLVAPGLAEGSAVVIITAAALVFTTLSLGQGDPRSPGTAGGWAAKAGIALATVVGPSSSSKRSAACAQWRRRSCRPPKVVSVLLSVAVLGERVDLTQGPDWSSSSWPSCLRATHRPGNRPLPRCRRGNEAAARIVLTRAGPSDPAGRWGAVGRWRPAVAPCRCFHQVGIVVADLQKAMGSMSAALG